MPEEDVIQGLEEAEPWKINAWRRNMKAQTWRFKLILTNHQI
jgi:hypothetical protein